MARKNSKIFLSYARSDRRAVKGIGDQLQQAGFEVWDPDQEILPGSAWGTELKEALDSAAAVVVFISPDAMDSRSVSSEIEYALGAKHLRGRLIAVTLRPTSKAPWILKSPESIRYENVSKTGQQIVDLLKQAPDATKGQERAG